MENTNNYQRLVINSDDRNYGTSSQFRIQIGFRIDRVTSVQLVSAIIPNSIYVFSPERLNQVITLLETAFPVTFLSIPDGSYNITDFISILSNILTFGSPSGSTYTVTYDTNTRKLNISTTGPAFSFLFGAGGNANNPYLEMGFNYNVNTIPATNLTAPNVVNLSGVPYLLLKLANLQHNINNTRNVSANFKVNLSTDFGFIEYYSPNYALENYHTINEQSIQYLDVLLTDDNGVPVNLNGAEWSFTICYTTNNGPTQTVY